MSQEGRGPPGKEAPGSDAVTLVTRVLRVQHPSRQAAAHLLKTPRGNPCAVAVPLEGMGGTYSRSPPGG